MNEEPVSTRLRVRLLVWFGAAVILIPVLYVAASGPLEWWRIFHLRDFERFDGYSRSLLPLYRTPESAGVMLSYTGWWRGLPAPRSWRRSGMLERIEEVKVMIEQARADQKRDEAEFAEDDGLTPNSRAVRLERLNEHLRAAEQWLQQIDSR